MKYKAIICDVYVTDNYPMGEIYFSDGRNRRTSVLDSGIIDKDM